jgi:hypothetical protein
MEIQLMKYFYLISLNIPLTKRVTRTLRAGALNR